MDGPADLRLTAFVEEGDDGLYVARAIEVKLSGSGETPEAALENLRRVAEIFFALLFASGLSAGQVGSATTLFDPDEPDLGE